MRRGDPWVALATHQAMWNPWVALANFDLQ